MGGGEGTTEESPPAGRVTDETEGFTAKGEPYLQESLFVFGFVFLGDLCGRKGAADVRDLL